MIKNMACSEHAEQCNVISWFRIQYPHLRNRLFAIPNGGMRNLIVAKKLKAEGVLPGVADLFLMHANIIYHGLFIEMKTLKGVQSQHQKEFQKEAINAGYCYHVAHGFYDARDFINFYLDR